MKKIITLLLVMMCVLIVSAQDKIVLHNGTNAVGKVTELNDSYLKFVHEGENLVQTYGCNAVDSVILASGRTLKMSDKVVITSPKDWENVKVVYDKNEVMGLKSLGKIEKHSNGGWSFHVSLGHFIKKALNKAKKEAALRGAPILFIEEQKDSNMGFFKNAESTILCNLYTY